MKTLSGKKILLGICGGIAAYKCPELVRELRRAGAEVRVVMTAGASAFVTALTLQTLSEHPVHQVLLDDQQEAAMSHIELARWADWIVIAPATAQCMAKLAQGFADDLLSTLCLATTSPIIIAPAMNLQMWSHSATQANLEILISRGVQVFGPAVGEQACGEFGPGRMLEPHEIVEQLIAFIGPPLLRDLNVLITAGPTQEPIDPVRFITNHSSGKMGYALAAAAQRAGATVTLISGPTQLPCPSSVTRIAVNTAEEMYNAVNQQLANQAIFISAAAVTDYRPSQTSEQKIKTKTSSLALECTKNPDILASLAERSPRPFTVGFAAETENVLENARDKLQKKRCDLIIANSVSGVSSAFGSEENQVTVLSKDQTWEFERLSKQTLATKLIALIASQLPQSL
jgi:phosphopantothenoylcysteine decarboxylase / phosphopantothenate---cysteine ligase